MSSELNRDTVICKIASGASLSGVIDIDGGLAYSLHMPSAWTTANLTFQASYDGTTFNNVYDDAGNEVTVTAAASRAITILSNYLTPFKYIKIRSGTSGSAVNQAADRAIIVELKR